MAQSVDAQLQTMIDNMPEKTGKSLEEWFAILSAAGLEEHGAIMKLLKGEHGVTHGFANTISALYRQRLAGGPPEETDLVTAQYEKKANLRPIYDRIVEIVTGFGDDMAIAPKKSYVSLRRNKQFGIIKPSTKTRVDLGVNFSDVEPTGKLQAGKSFRGMCSHQIPLTSVDEIDEEVISWLCKAYEEA